jgi:WhiB family redox-sensing transcriptional regulator
LADADREWMANAACRQSDSDIFFPVAHEKGREAKRICRDCPVRVECLAWAIKTKQEYGVWGGASPETRRRR